jgi:hypothetical protein
MTTICPTPGTAPDLYFSVGLTGLEPATLAQRARLSGVHLHTPRHTAASLLLTSETHTKVLHEHLGHSSYNITAGSYSHVTPASSERPQTAWTRLSLVRAGQGERGCCTDEQRGSALSDGAPLTCYFSVGLTGFEPATH